MAFFFISVSCSNCGNTIHIPYLPGTKITSKDIPEYILCQNCENLQWLESIWEAPAYGED